MSRLVIAATLCVLLANTGFAQLEGGDTGQGPNKIDSIGTITLTKGAMGSRTIQASAPYSIGGTAADTHIIRYDYYEVGINAAATTFTQTGFGSNVSGNTTGSSNALMSGKTYYVKITLVRNGADVLSSTSGNMVAP